MLSSASSRTSGNISLGGRSRGRSRPPPAENFHLELESPLVPTKLDELLLLLAHQLDVAAIFVDLVELRRRSGHPAPVRMRARCGHLRSWRWFRQGQLRG